MTLRINADFDQGIVFSLATITGSIRLLERAKALKTLTYLG